MLKDIIERMLDDLGLYYAESLEGLYLVKASKECHFGFFLQAHVPHRIYISPITAWRPQDLSPSLMKTGLRWSSHDCAIFDLHDPTSIRKMSKMLKSCAGKDCNDCLEGLDGID